MNFKYLPDNKEIFTISSMIGSSSSLYYLGCRQGLNNGYTVHRDAYIKFFDGVCCYSHDKNAEFVCQKLSRGNMWQFQYSITAYPVRQLCVYLFHILLYLWIKTISTPRKTLYSPFYIHSCMFHNVALKRLGAMSSLFSCDLS